MTDTDILCPIDCEKIRVTLTTLYMADYYYLKEIGMRNIEEEKERE